MNVFIKFTQQEVFYLHNLIKDINDCDKKLKEKFEKKVKIIKKYLKDNIKNNKKLDHETIFNKIREFDLHLTRKPWNIKDISTVNSKLYDNDKFLSLLSMLNIYETKDCMKYESDKFFAYCELIVKDLTFILHHNDEYYLVNTEGYKYCRYIGKLPKFLFE